MKEKDLGSFRYRCVGDDARFGDRVGYEVQTKARPTPLTTCLSPQGSFSCYRRFNWVKVDVLELQERISVESPHVELRFHLAAPCFSTMSTCTKIPQH